MEHGFPQLVLASASPRRADLLALVGVQPIISPTDVDETPISGESAAAMVERLASAKAEAFGANGPSVVIGSDTTVVVDSHILGKPIDSAEAETMLTRLQGRDHEVLTGVAVRLTDGQGVTQKIISRVDRSVVTMREIDSDERAWYVATGEPLGKAGAYAIQGFGSVFVTGVVGSYHNVVGLPLAMLDALVTELGLPLRLFIGEP